MKPDFVVPVIDIMNGLVVQAVAGRRNEYKPIESPLLSSPDPLHFVESFFKKFQFRLFYLADLDAIMGNESNLDVIEKLVSDKSRRLWVDGGYRTMDDIYDHPQVTPVIATETFERFDTADDLSKAVISIDTKEGEPLAANHGLTIENAISHARAAGAKRFIYLRLEAVGRSMFDAASLPAPKDDELWYAAGGIRSSDDLQTLLRMGYAGALVSTAIHKGDLPLNLSTTGWASQSSSQTISSSEKK